MALIKVHQLAYDGECRKCGMALKVGTQAWWDKGGKRGAKLLCAGCHDNKKGDGMPDKQPLTLTQVIGVSDDHPIFDGAKLVATFNKADLISIANNVGHMYRISSRSKADLAGRIADASRSKGDDVYKYLKEGAPLPMPENGGWGTPEKEAYDQWIREWTTNRYAFSSAAEGLHKAVKCADEILKLSGKEVAGPKPKKKGEKGVELRFKSNQIDEIQASLEDHISGVLSGELAATRAQTQSMVDQSQKEMLNAKNRVMREVREHLADLSIPQKVVVQRPEMPDIDMGHQHHRFADLISLLNAGITVMVVGPAGSGKSTAPEVYAESIERRFLPMSLGPHTMQSQITGYKDGGSGAYVSTPFRDFFENGGVVLLDELDRCNERVAVTLNAALANRICSFPDKVVKQHPDCLIIAAGNTAGHGADRQYVSARQQDAALMDRFAILEWGYDHGFELALAKSIYNGCDDWVEKVWAVREAVGKHKMRYVVSPRASLQGAQGLAAGLDHGLLESTILYRGWTDEDRQKIEGEVGDKEF
jgi:hypothetical protein